MSDNLSAPSYIRGIEPYKAGKPISELAREKGLQPENILKLASNENPLGAPGIRAAGSPGSRDRT